jgi:hypothetical protein
MFDFQEHFCTWGSFVSTALKLTAHHKGANIPNHGDGLILLGSQRTDSANLHTFSIFAKKFLAKKRTKHAGFAHSDNSFQAEPLPSSSSNRSWNPS